ncbi:MAG: CHY zinc finger protein [Chitinophagaceae bacterium]
MSNKADKEIKGKLVDNNTRCIHYQSPLDVIAIRFKCCREYCPCYKCHEETAGHKAEIWKKDGWEQAAIICGLCKHEMTIYEYVNSGNQYPSCSGLFNPN